MLRSDGACVSAPRRFGSGFTERYRQQTVRPGERMASTCERRFLMPRLRRVARRRRRRMAGRRILLVGGMVAIGTKKMSAAQAKQIEEHTGVPPEGLGETGPP